MNNKTLTILAVVGLYFVSTGISYATFSLFTAPPETQTITNPEPLTQDAADAKRLRIDPSQPKTEQCPLNGAMFTKEEKDIWSARRPLAVMIENHTDARPQSGLGSADVVYEAVAEGGITRFMGVYLCGASAMDIDLGPIRSARTYFLDWASEYGEYPLYAHVGGANCNPSTGSGCANGAKADALGQIRDYDWNLYNDINQMIGGDVGIKVFKRDNRLEKYTGNRNIAIEHTMYSSTDKLYEVGVNRGLGYTDKEGLPWDESFVSWKFAQDPQPNPEAPVDSVELVFWANQFKNDFVVNWQYDPATNTYKRNMAGEPHLDLNTEEQITASTVIAAVMVESSANDGYTNNLHNLYANKGTNDAYIFMNGEVIEGKWRKKNRLSRTIFTDNSGTEIELNPGPIWIEIIPEEVKQSEFINYKTAQ